MSLSPASAPAAVAGQNSPVQLLDGKFKCMLGTCQKPSWNGNPNEFCSTLCKKAHAAQKAADPGPGAVGSSPEMAGHTGAMGVLSAAAAAAPGFAGYNPPVQLPDGKFKCTMGTCQKPSWDGRPNDFCSSVCKKAHAAQPAARLAGHASVWLSMAVSLLAKAAHYQQERQPDGKVADQVFDWLWFVAMAAYSRRTTAPARFLDTANVSDSKTLLPLMGFDQTPQVSFAEACKPLMFIVELGRMMTLCIAMVRKRKASGEIDLNFPEDLACMLSLYSASWTVAAQSFYHMMNGALRTEDRSQVKPWYSALCLMCTAVKALQPVTGILYRGVRGNLASKYQKGDRVVWWAWSSCTAELNVLENEDFLGQTGERTLFEIRDAVGFDIQQFSWYKKEAEVLLPPGTEVVVTGSLNAAPGLTIIQLQMVQTDNCIIDLNKHLPAAELKVRLSLSSVRAGVRADEPAAEPDAVLPPSKETVKGLSDILSIAKIEQPAIAKIERWCFVNQAVELEEVLENLDDIATFAELPCCPKTRLKKALSRQGADALGPQLHEHAEILASTPRT